MPIYEYRCADCKRRVSVFFMSFSVADRRTEAGEVECPRCGGKRLSRLVSKVNMVRGGGPVGDGMAEDMGDGGMGGMDDMGGMGGMEGMFEGLDDEDPRSVARWARRMKDSMGDEMDMGPEFDQALARIEAGEDPDKVMDDMDPEALGGPGGEEMEEL
ncbi:MAG: zinc ribbon domain-containing protein [Chloroflexia bacterium]